MIGVAHLQGADPELDRAAVEDHARDMKTRRIFRKINRFARRGEKGTDAAPQDDRIPPVATRHRPAYMATHY